MSDSSRHPHRTGAAPCWVALSISPVEHVRACPGPAPFRPRNCPFTCWDLRPASRPNVCFLDAPESTSKAASRSVPPLLRGSRSWPTDQQTASQTDVPCYSVCSNRPHIASAATRQIIRTKIGRTPRHTDHVILRVRSAYLGFMRSVLLPRSRIRYLGKKFANFNEFS